jgi:tellurite resistance protein
MSLPSSDPFGERRKSLEEAFFKDKDRQLMEKMRSEMAAMEEKNKLAHVSGITDPKVLDNLVKAGVGAETLAAVALVPMVEVAWCDGSVSPDERDAVLNAAAAQGVQPGTAPYAILESWLKMRPDSHVVMAWKDYVRALASLMPKETLAEMKRTTIDRATRVAESAGGFLGISTISASERATINEFAKAFDG